MSFSSGFASAFQQPGVNQNVNAYYPSQVYASSPSPQPQPVQGPQPSVGVSLGGGGGGGSSAAEQEALASIAASMAADQAARLVYQEWQMRTGDERLAMDKAQQAWSQTFETERQKWTQTYQTAGLTGTLEGQATLPRLAQEAGFLGTYNGQQTQQAQQQAWAQQFAQQGLGQQGALALLQAQSALQGPRDWHRYWQQAASAPQGLTSALSSLAGQYRFAPGAQGTPGPATLQSRTQDLLAGGQQGQPAASQGAQGGAGQTSGLPNPWQLNVQNYANMSPSMQQGVLGGYEAAGYFGPDVEQLLRQAAPRYTGPPTAGIGL